MRTVATAGGTRPAFDSSRLMGRFMARAPRPAHTKWQQEHHQALQSAHMCTGASGQCVHRCISTSPIKHPTSLELEAGTHTRMPGIVWVCDRTRGCNCGKPLQHPGLMAGKLTRPKLGLQHNPYQPTPTSSSTKVQPTLTHRCGHCEGHSKPAETSQQVTLVGG